MCADYIAWHECGKFNSGKLSRVWAHKALLSNTKDVHAMNEMQKKKPSLNGIVL